MRRSLLPILAACLAVFMFASPKPASALPAGAAKAYGESHSGVVEEVGKKYKYGKNWNKKYRYRSYGYRGYPRYRSYGYYRPYYRPYGYYRPYSYYGYGGYPYYRRPGISLWFGF